MPGLTLDAARTMIAAALEKGRELDLNPLAVAVLDAGARLTAFEKQDGASTLRFEIAHGKANGALAMGLGMRPLTQDIIAGVYVRESFKAGTRVHIEELDIDATVLAVGPVSTRMRSEVPGGPEEGVLPNHTMISSVVKTTQGDDVDGADA